MAYGTPVLAPMYSDERTALSGDFGSGPNSSRPPPVTLLYYSQIRPGNYDQVYPHEQSTSGSHPQNWQTAERASTRLVARGTVNEAPPAQQHRYAMPPGFFAPLGAMIFQQGPPPVPQPPPKVPKRRAAENEDTAPGPKSKKAKSKGKSAADGAVAGSTSKRGYNAKKRNEAAQIAAQNAQLMPSVSYSQSSSEQGDKRPDAKTMRIVQDASSHPEASGPLHPELQFARCMSNRYKNEQFPRCVSCTRRWAGDTCRFQGIRFFLKDNNRNIVGISFVENQKPDAPAMTFPAVWNIPLQAVHIRRTKRAIAHALLPTLQQELEHLRTPEIIRRPRENEVRATCDTCMTSLFSSSWMCRLCGREACAECFEQVKDLTDGNPGANEAEVIALQIKREKHSHSNPFFLACTRRNEHQSKDFSPMSRFCKAELAEAINEMEALIRTPDIDALPGIGAIDPALQGPSTQTSQINGTSAFTRFFNGHVPEPAISSIASSSVPSNNAQIDPALLPSIAVADIPCHTPKYFTDEELTEEVFRPLWQKGEPLVVTGLLPKFKIKWTPEYFIEKYESQACLILECQTDVNKRITVGEFFSWFGKYNGRTECWKLKDWPPSTDFKTAFPELFEDFSRAVPVPNYVRRDGTLNVASHFPANTIAPDLGPKMYNAMASFECAGSKGSTRLHMDMADALNIMTFASLTPDGQPGTAAWDLFRAEDSDKIRQFLKKKFKGAFQHDPIHSQQCYLDTTLRHELWTEFGVKSYRIYQKPGEAVFIPAGCAHQVCNLADCVKVAVDFVSPENIARCEKLTKEFREQNQSMVWKEDVLQLRTMMWFAWLSCCLQEKEMA
ncbi:hypothetical protein PILCRDRAFT_818994, partial [Piloderma croceum F 1598]